MIDTAIIPCAGLGTRMHPATKIFAKEALPIGKTPAIDFILNNLIKNGIKHLVIVSNKWKTPLNTYIKEEYSNSFDSIKFIYQYEPNGLLDAIIRGQKQLKKDFIVVLPDEIWLEGISLTDLTSAPYTVYVKHVSYLDIEKYGILLTNLHQEPTYILEKPSLKDIPVSPKYLALCGLYSFDLEHFRQHAISQNVKDLTEYLQICVAQRKLDYQVINTQNYDIGNELGYLLANNYILKKKRGY